MLFRAFGAQFALQVPHGQIIEGEAALPRPHQVRRQCRVRGDTAERPTTAGQIVHGQLGLVQRLGRPRVGKPGRQCFLVLSGQGGGVDVAAITVSRDDGQRGGIGVIGQVGSDDRHPEPVAQAVFGKPRGQLTRLQRAPTDIEPMLGLRLGGHQGVEQPIPQHPELQVVEQPVDLVTVPGQQPQGVRGLSQGHVLDQLGQLTVEHDAGQIGPQRLADLALDLVDVVDQALQ